MDEPTRDGRGWPRAAGLVLATIAFSVIGPGVLIGLPFVLLALFLRPRGSALVLGIFLATVVVVGTGPSGGMWYLERGWAILLGGWFLGLTLRWPRSRFFPRALGAVAGAYGVAALVFRVRPESWSVVDWMVTDRMRAGTSAALTALRSVGGEGMVPGEVSDAIYRTLESQGVVFPALLGLASVAALGVAWWIWVRLAHGSDGGLGPLRDFRFNDQLVWLFVVGLALVLLGSSGAWDRLGTNAVVFMGGLYALRGAAVLLFLSGGVSVAGSLLLAVAFVFVAPVLVAGALVVGLGDTWFDLRARIRAASGTDG